MPSSVRIVAAFAALSALPFPESLHAGAKRQNLSAAKATGQVLRIKADLDGINALPVNSGPASGSVEGTYEPATHILRFHAYFIGLSGPATNAKFYGAAGIDHAGWPTVAAPRPEASLVTGTAWLDREEEQDLLNGRWFFNVTTLEHPQGEIRGAVQVTSANLAALSTTTNERNDR